MSVQAAARTAILAKKDPERGHRVRLALSWLLAAAVILVIAGYGYDYYTLGSIQRPFSPKHDLLRPSGSIGVKLGMLGTFMFFLIYLYPLRKKWGWLAHQGNSRHWLDFHVVLGTAAPLIIVFHSSFKFGNIAGTAFWSMLAVTMSGFIGRYLYSQIPRNLTAVALSMKEMQDMEGAMGRYLAAHRRGLSQQLKGLCKLPDASSVDRSSLLTSLFWMILIDCKRPLQVSRLRLQSAGFGSWLISFFGLRPTHDEELEIVIQVARRESALSKRNLFLSRAQRLFLLWHIVHRPFSYAFAILALLHIGTVLFMGYRH